MFDESNGKSARDEVLAFLLERIRFYKNVDGNREENNVAFKKQFFFTTLARFLGATDKEIYL